MNLRVGAVLLEGAVLYTLSGAGGGGYTHCLGGGGGGYTHCLGGGGGGGYTHFQYTNHLKVHFRDKRDFKPGHHFRAY